VKRLLVSGPRGIVERDRAGGFPAQGLWSRSARAPDPDAGGTVQSADQRMLAERLAKSVTGVRRVVNTLDVRSAPE
jgi:hypothetical protein